MALYGQDRRCSPAILNMRDNGGDSAVILAVFKGDLACVKEMDKLEGTNFRTNNNDGDNLVDVAREEDHEDVLEYLLDKNRNVETLTDMAAYNVAKYIESERDLGALEIPQVLKNRVSKYLDK